MSRYMIDTYAEYKRILNRPAGMTVKEAISEYMNLSLDDDYAIELAKARYYYHTRTPYFYNWLNGENVVRPATPAAPVVAKTETRDMGFKPSMLRNFDDHELVLTRPKGVSVCEALVLYGLAPANDREAVQTAYVRYQYWLNSWKDYYNTNPRGLRDLAMAGRFGIPTEEDQAPVDADEDQYPLDVEIDLDDCMREGDVVVAIFDYSRDVVQIKFIDGDHVCVKTLDGSLKISKLEDLRHIPENF